MALNEIMESVLITPSTLYNTSFTPLIKDLLSCRPSTYHPNIFMHSQLSATQLQDLVPADKSKFYNAMLARVNEENEMFISITCTRFPKKKC